MTDPTLRQQAIQLLAASGLQPTAQNMQRVQSLIAGGALGSGNSDGGGETSSRTLDRVSGTTAPSHAPPASHPKAPQGRQAGPNSTGPAQQPDVDADADVDTGRGGDTDNDASKMMQDVVNGAFGGSNVPTAQADVAPAISDDIWNKILAGAGIAGGAGAAGLVTKKLIGSAPRIPVIGEVPAGTQPTAPGDIGLGETHGDPIMDPNIKPDTAPTIAGADVGEAPALRRMMPEDVNPAPRPSGLESGKIMPDEPLPLWAGNPAGDVTSPEMSIGTDLSNADAVSVGARAKAENDARVRRNVDLTNAMDDAGFTERFKDVNPDNVNKIKALERQMSVPEWNNLSRVLTKNGVADSIRNSQEMVRALRQALRAIR